ncbi:MAG: hypothetical protein ACLTQE_17030 [Proteus mirabilis]|nr:hypothetical protein [Proteus mirabilis]HEK0657951.1 hypothetical protein [Proteus mirabilis]HEK2073297.1 hypothetical protein [Proteus mirabilis]
MSEFDKWKDFKKLTTLKISFYDSVNAKSAEIFGNGKNQVKLRIQVNVIDKNNEQIFISDDEISKILSLVTYSTGEKISHNGRPSSVKHWNSSLVASAFPYAFSYSTSLTRDENTDENAKELRADQNFIFYLTANNVSAEQNIDIAAQIDIPNVGAFNTTSDGTDTKNSPKGENGSPFRAPSSVHVKAMIPIDYSDITKLQLIQSSWSPVKKQTFVVHNYKSDSKYWTKENGASLYRSTVKITPKLSDKLKFTEVKRAYFAIHSEDLIENKGMATWRHKKEPGILLRDGGDYSALFVAVGGFGKNVNHPDYDTYFWLRPLSVSPTIKGYFHLADSVWQYRTEVNIPLLNTSVGGGEVDLVGYKISTPTGPNVYSNHWEGKSGPVTCSVVDNYGNKGKFKIIFFSDKSHYEKLGDVHLE